MSDFRMPSLGADMESGTLVAWRVEPGDTVHRGNVIADVETQKGVIEVQVFEEGVVEELVVQPGTRVPVGAVLAHIRTGPGAPKPVESHEAKVPAAVAAGAADERSGVAPLPEAHAHAPPAAAAPTPRRPAPAPPPGKAERRPRASPLAKRVARELGVDLASIAGTGAAGAITKADVERAATGKVSTPREAPAAPRAPVAAPFATPPAATAMRAAIAAAMSRANREIPHYYLAEDIPLHRGMAWLAEHNAPRPPAERILPAALLLKSVALALREIPDLNGFWVDDAFQAGSGIHLGVAIALRGGGLIAPAIHDADQLALEALMQAMLGLVQRARAGGLRSSELTDPTITVTNLGDRGVRSVFGVIYPPQVALVGFGRIAERPWAENGLLGVRPVVTATLAADHRASDGHRGALFLAAVSRLLQHPEEL